MSKDAGAPAVDLTSTIISVAVLDNLSEQNASRLQALPLELRDDTLFVAVVDPNDANLLREVGFLTGKKIVPYAAPESQLKDAITGAYGARRSGLPEWRGRRVRQPRATQPILRQAEPPGAPPQVKEPFQGETSYHPTAPLTDVRGRTKTRVLVVDDEAPIRRILHHGLTARGYEVIEAQSGMDALRMIKEREPDVLLLDAMLPDVHGFDICKRLKESKRYSSIPVIMMTALYKGWRMAADLRESYGVNAVIEKPFDIQDVVRHLDAAIAGIPPERADHEQLSAEAQRLYTEGSAAYAAGDVDKAMELIAAAVAVDPLSATLRHQLGLLYAHRGHDFAAIQELEVAIELEPARFQTLRNLAVLYQRRGFRRKATEYWERSLAQAPDEATKNEVKTILVQLL